MKEMKPQTQDPSLKQEPWPLLTESLNVNLANAKKVQKFYVYVNCQKSVPIKETQHFFPSNSTLFAQLYNPFSQPSPLLL